MRKTLYDFSGKLVFVTGGARGIGKAICEWFAASNAQVVACARREPASPFSVPGIDFIHLDIRDYQASADVFELIRKKYGRLDVLVNNAGGSPLAASAAVSANFTQKVVELNLVAPLVLSQQAYGLLEGCENSSIINIASISDVRPSPGTVAYGAAKSGLVNASRTLAQEWGPGIRVNAIISGMVETELTDEHYGDIEGKQRVENSIGLKRFGRPEDIAAACLFLASEEARYISGAALEVHGGGEIALSVDTGRDVQVGGQENVQC